MTQSFARFLLESYLRVGWIMVPFGSGPVTVIAIASGSPAAVIVLFFFIATIVIGIAAKIVERYWRRHRARSADGSA